jgi:hypothetical protein
VLLEADLVRVVGIGLVAVDGLRSVGVLDRGFLLWLVVWGLGVVAHAAELRWCGGVAALGTCWAAGVAGDGRRGLEAVELRGGVHLRRLLVYLGLWAVHVAVGDGTRGARAGMLLVEGIRVDESAVAGLWLRAIVEYPYDLGLSVAVPEEGAAVLTQIMDRRM